MGDGQEEEIMSDQERRCGEDMRTVALVGSTDFTRRNIGACTFLACSEKGADHRSKEKHSEGLPTD